MLLKTDDDDDVFSCSPKKANTEEKYKKNIQRKIQNQLF